MCERWRNWVSLSSVFLCFVFDVICHFVAHNPYSYLMITDSRLVILWCNTHLPPPPPTSSPPSRQTLPHSSKMAGRFGSFSRGLTTVLRKTTLKEHLQRLENEAFANWGVQVSSRGVFQRLILIRQFVHELLLNFKNSFKKRVISTVCQTFRYPLSIFTKYIYFWWWLQASRNVDIKMSYRCFVSTVYFLVKNSVSIRALLRLQHLH